MIRAVHAKYVLDASVAAKWFTTHDEPHRAKAAEIRSLHVEGRCKLVIPEFALLEIANAVRYSARADEEAVARAMTLLEQLRLEVVPLDWELLRKANAVAWGYGTALYDAAYVALAEREGVPLLTADDALAKKLAGHGLVVRLASLALP